MKLTKKEIAEFEKLKTEAEDAALEAETKLQALRAFAEERQSAAQESFEDKSERWQESEAGEQVSSWADAWEEIACLDEIDVDIPEIPFDSKEV